MSEPFAPAAPREADDRATMPRVTVLSGFLGAGKTTVLKCLLSQAAGARWAAVVNDLASLNLDAALVEAAQGGDGVVGVGGGCVCCTARDDLAETVARLAADGKYPHIFVETTGVAEPRALAGVFNRRNMFGRCLNDFAVLANLVTVVDTPDWLRDWRRRDEAVAEGTLKPVFELKVEQVECADVVMLNKEDLTSPDDLAAARAAVGALNPRAEILVTREGRIDAGSLLGRERFDAQATLAAASWIDALNAVAPAVARPAGPRVTRGPARAAATRGITSFVWQARRPLRREAWRARIEAGWPGLLRAKGFFWEVERPNEMGFLSLAGGVPRYEFLNYWWAALIEEGRVAASARPPTILALWEEPAGDRRQEIVFIGLGLDEARVRAEMEACLG